MVSILRRFGHNPIRLDLRQIRVFSVDPPGCKDIDDALHCTALPNGNYEVGVRILYKIFHFPMEIVKLELVTEI
ncbi:hypothetical protein LWI29_027693 [Acer saccharum]|uniref:RNB domain-containing protein n=1 Tax=Acer saccharum TaxID=4024 RepID=A0AA39VVU9_ACESA|nr:hypothetical protein LWI29_027693 [Acer saccharum]